MELRHATSRSNVCRTALRIGAPFYIPLLVRATVSLSVIEQIRTAGRANGSAHLLAVTPVVCGARLLGQSSEDEGEVTVRPLSLRGATHG